MLQDLIVLGLPYTSTEEDLKDYFEKYGELAHWEVCIISFFEIKHEVVGIYSRK